MSRTNGYKRRPDANEIMKSPQNNNKSSKSGRKKKQSITGHFEPSLTYHEERILNIANKRKKTGDDKIGSSQINLDKVANKIKTYQNAP